MRSLLLDFPKDKQLRKVDDEFMFGDALLAAPLLGTNSSRNVVLPAGVNWYDLNAKCWRKGGTTVAVNVSPGQMPLFAKENSLLPVAQPVQQIETNTVFAITVNAFGDQPKPFTLYADDGTTFDFESGAINRVILSWSRSNGGQVNRSGNFSRKRYDIVRWETVPGPNE